MISMTVGSHEDLPAPNAVLRQEPSDPPDERNEHRAVGLHCKIFAASPGWVWHNKRKVWLPLDDDLTAVTLYENRVRGWFLDWASDLTKRHDAGFVVLMVAVGYLEGNQQYRDGATSKNNSKAFVRRALQRLFPWLSAVQADEFYCRVRCGLFHDGFTRAKVGIENRLPSALSMDSDQFLVSPNKFLGVVVADFDSYLADLRTPASTSLPLFIGRWRDGDG